MEWENGEKNMSDLISRSALIEEIREYGIYGSGYSDAERENDVIDRIESQPTIEAIPVVHGFNDNRNYHECDEFRCSECGLHLEGWVRHVYDEELDDEFIKEYVFKYCPECGAKMEGGK